MASREVRAGKAYVEIGLRDRVEGGLKRVAARLRGFAAGVGAVGRPMLALGTALAAPLALATAVFANFDDQMRAVKAVTQANEDQFAQLRATAQELGRTTSFTAGQVAALMTELGRAGFKPDQIDRMTASVLDLSRATSTDATLASGIMAAAIRQFSLQAGDASRVADALTVAANKSFNTLESLGESLTYAGPVASDFNMSIEDTLALLGALGNVGIQGSNAGTALRRLLTISGAEAGKLKDIFGVSFVDMHNNARPLVDVLDEVNQATAGLGTAARAQKFNEAFGLLGITGASALSKNAVNVRELRDALADANGVAARTHKEMESGIGGTFRRIMSAVEGTAIAVGDALAPALQALEPIVTKVVGSVTQWIGEHKMLITSLAAGVAAILGIGGLLVTIAGAANLAAVAFSAAAMLWSGVTGVLAAVGAAIGVVLSPIGLLVTGVLAAAGAWLYFSGVGGEAIRWLQARFAELKAFVSRVAGGMYESLQAGNLRGAADILWSALKVAFHRGVEELGAVWQRLTGLLQPVFTWIETGWNGVVGFIAGVWAKLPEMITGPLAAVGEFFGQLFGGLLSIAGTALQGVYNAVLEGDWEAAGQIIMSGLEAAWLTGVAKLTEIWQGLKTAMIEAFAGVVIAVHKMWSGMVDGLAKTLLDLAAQDGAVGAVARKLVGVDMRAEDARAQQAEMQRRDVAKRNLEWTIGQWQQERTVATESGDTARVEQLTAAIAQAEQELAGLSGPFASATEQAKQIVQDATRDAQDAVGAYWGGIAGDARQSADAAIDAARGAANAARQQLEQQAAVPDLPDTKSPLQKAREELEAAMAAVKKKTGSFDADAAQQRVNEAGRGLGDLPGSASATAGEIAGTFNAAAVRGLGADSLAQRTARATEQVAKNTNELVKQARDGNLVFA